MLRSLTRSFNRLSPPKKLAVTTAALIGGGTLIGIPILSLNPAGLSTVFNEDAYEETQLTEQSPAREKTTSSKADRVDTTTLPQLFVVPDGSTGIPDVDSLDSKAETKLDATDTPSGVEGSAQKPSNTSSNLPNSTNNPYSKPPTPNYSSGSLSRNPYSSSQPSSLNTPYSLSSPSVGSSTSNPYSSQPSLGNSYTNPSTQPSLGTYTNPSTQPSLGTYTNPSTQPSLGTYTNPSTQPSLGTYTNPSTQPSLGTYTNPSTQPSSSSYNDSFNTTTNLNNSVTTPGTTSIPSVPAIAPNTFTNSPETATPKP